MFCSLVVFQKTSRWMACENCAGYRVEVSVQGSILNPLLFINSLVGHNNSKIGCLWILLYIDELVVIAKLHLSDEDLGKTFQATKLSLEFNTPRNKSNMQV